MLHKNGFYDICNCYMSNNPDDNEIMLRILYLLSELVFNKSNRISIKSSNSCNFSSNQSNFNKF